MNVYTHAAISNLIAALCFCGTWSLIYYDKPHWGWLLFAGLCCMTSVEKEDKA